ADHRSSGHPLASARCDRAAPRVAIDAPPVAIPPASSAGLLWLLAGRWVPARRGGGPQQRMLGATAQPVQVRVRLGWRPLGNLAGRKAIESWRERPTGSRPTGRASMPPHLPPTSRGLRTQNSREWRKTKDRAKRVDVT